MFLSIILAKYELLYLDGNLLMKKHICLITYLNFLTEQKPLDIRLKF